MKNQLLTLSKENAQGVGQHLVMAARLLDAEDYEAALAHAETAARRAGRVPAVREALGLVHYATAEYAKALTEFRTARRLSGTDHLLPYLVDCERALGRPEKALELAHSPQARALPPADQVELLVIESGIRRDLGQLEASRLGLEVGALDSGAGQPWYPRLTYAYAEALLALGDEDGARRWFARADTYDTDGTTDAAERLDELDGNVFLDLGDDEGDDDRADSGGPEAGGDAGTVEPNQAPGRDVPQPAARAESATAPDRVGRPEPSEPSGRPAAPDAPGTA